MEFETKEVNGGIVYVRKNKKVVHQREDLPGNSTLVNDNSFIKILEELHSCSHDCSSCHSKCGE